MSDTLEIFGTEYTGVTGIKATDDNNQTKTYIRPQGTKSITSNGTGIDVSAYATADVSVSAPSPTLQTITKTYTPSTTAVTDTITPSSGYDGIEEVDVTVSAVPTAVPFVSNENSHYYNYGSLRKWSIQPFVEVDTAEGDVAGYLAAGTHINGEANEFNAIASGTSVTPTESSQTIGGANVMLEGAVTVNAIPSNYVGSAVPRRDDSDLSGVYDDGAYNVNVPSGYFQYPAYTTVPNGTEGTPTATKGTVSNHSVSVTPSVTNTAGYITGGTKTGTAVSVSASELVSGTLSITQNGTADVTNYASVDVSVSGGGGAFAVDTATKTLTASASSISFTSLSGEPTSFVITSSADQTTGGTKAVSIAYDGTNLFGMDITTQMVNDTGFTKSYSGGTLTITATSATFEANEYKLVYTYGGSSSDIHTDDVQVGSGATSITFTSLAGKPAYFSCVFKSTFGTSSGYQRVIDVVYDGTNTYGHAMDSSAKAQTSWSYSYSGGSLTITSTGTNNGGYFHQPGYYQLTYGVDPNEPNLQTKTNIGASTSSQTITADNGYDGLESVQINAVSQTNLTAANIKSGTTVTISNGSSNLWSVTGTYGGGGSSMNAQSHQSTSRSTSTTATSLNSLTCSTTGTYTVTWTCTRSSTSGTWSSQLYVGGTASGSSQTTWSNHVQTVSLTNVSISANQTVAVYGVSRGSNYYIYAPQLTIVQTS